MCLDRPVSLDRELRKLNCNMIAFDLLLGHAGLDTVMVYAKLYPRR